MSLIGRNIGLTLAVLLALFLTLARYHGESAVPPAPPVAVITIPPPTAPIVKVRKKVHIKVALKPTAPPAAPRKIRGARLREKGEALGGSTPDRVDTGTMTLPASQ
jgi:hypothetical protein